MLDPLQFRPSARTLALRSGIRGGRRLALAPTSTASTTSSASTRGTGDRVIVATALVAAGVAAAQASATNAVLREVMGRTWAGP